MVCDGLKGLPEAITTVWPPALVQTCVLHLIRNTFRYASRRYWEQMAKDLRPVYTAPTEAAAKARFDEFAEKWGGQYPAIVALWRSAWSEFVPFLDYDVEIRRVICSTNAIESAQRPLPARGQGPRALPDRAGRAEVPLPRHPIPRPDREGPGQVGDALEARTQRLRDHLRRTYRPYQRKLAITTGYTAPQTPPDGVPRNRPTSSRRLRTPTLSKTALRWSCRV